MTSPGAGVPAPGNPDDDVQYDQDDRGERGSSWGLWAAVGSLTTAAFAAGLLVGVIIDGNAEIMREFREKSPDRRAATASAQPVRGPNADGPGSVEAAAKPDRRQNNQVDWAITIAPGTNVAPVDARTADLDADSKVEFGMVLGDQVSPVAALWVQAGSSAKIVLPIGRYSVRTTKVSFRSDDESGIQEPVVVDGMLDVMAGTRSTTPASLAANRSGTWRIAKATQKASDRPARTKTRRRASAKDFEYEGLGEGSRTGGTSTYDG
jgi:hypothetical protein